MTFNTTHCERKRQFKTDNVSVHRAAANSFPFSKQCPTAASVQRIVILHLLFVLVISRYSSRHSASAHSVLLGDILYNSSEQSKQNLCN
ncbi:hypothetical protein Poly51_48800 [Rubripirellula tenax]|uniref:Uncharacterized protein n=1 Tax=Rubripirellula tenax TaxID=2528015 RepID=A0A5C6EN33_9BACT|nr:hypothetical protein Poly51_48800 [Rubripirellula tenax]